MKCVKVNVIRQLSLAFDTKCFLFSLGLKLATIFHRKEIFRPEKSILIIQFHCFLSFLVAKVNDFNSKFLLSRELLTIKRGERLRFPLA